VLTNSLSALNIANSLLPPSTSGLAAVVRTGLAPTGSSLLLPMSGDMNSLRLLSSLAFLHSNLRGEDSFKQVGAGDWPHTGVGGRVDQGREGGKEGRGQEEGRTSEE
jgi:hypothetical protein